MNQMTCFVLLVNVILHPCPVTSRFDYNQIEVENKQVLLNSRAELLCPLVPHGHDALDGPVPEDIVTLLFWYKGLKSQVPFITVDTRNQSRHQATSAISYADLLSHWTRAEIRLSDLKGRHDGKQKGDSRHTITHTSGGAFHPRNSTIQAFLRSTGLSKQFAERAIFRIDLYQRFAMLVLNKVQAEDEGIYRCRVDFRWSRTTNVFFHLELIIPPTKLFISDQAGKSIVNGVAGPYEIGRSDIELVCETKPAKPSPLLHWYEGSALVDDTYELFFETGSASQASQRVVGRPAPDHLANASFAKYVHKPLVRAVNRLSLTRPLHRSDLFKEFRCIASNTDLVKPTQTIVSLDIILPPINVEIVLGSNDVFHSGQDAALLCRTHGSRPVAQIRWLWNGKRVTSNIKDRYDESNNLTTSVMHFVPRDTDHESLITCEAFNIQLPNIEPLTDLIKIQVLYLPKVELVQVEPAVENNLTPEGSPVRLACKIRANPPITEPVTWFINNTLIDVLDSTYKTEKVNDFYYTLLIERLSLHQHNGWFNCLVISSQGRSMSNSVLIRVAYAPRCRDAKSRVYGVSINESVDIVCEVEAHPPIVYFNWFYNGTPASNFKYTSRGPFSVLQFHARKRFDFGEVSCEAENAVGKMTTACHYQIIPYGKPDPISTCSMLYLAEENNAPMIKCHFDFNGGIETHCQLEMYRTQDSQVLWTGTENGNLSDLTHTCIFYPLNITSERAVKLRVTTFNLMGHSTPYHFISTLTEAHTALLTPDSIQANLSLDQPNNSTGPSFLSKVLEWSQEIIEDGDWIFILVLLILGVFLVALICTIRSIKKLNREHQVNIKAFHVMNVASQRPELGQLEDGICPHEEDNTELRLYSSTCNGHCRHCAQVEITEI